jgi:fructose-1,6-bisphosphatase/sedoheptulose 1,7-bisphosphatase-like protein
MFIGIGGAPEGVLAAAALRCIGGQMQCRLVLDTMEKRERAAKMGIDNPRKKYEVADMAFSRAAAMSSLAWIALSMAAISRTLVEGT